MIELSCFVRLTMSERLINSAGWRIKCATQGKSRSVSAGDARGRRQLERRLTPRRVDVGNHLKMVYANVGADLKLKVIETWIIV